VALDTRLGQNKSPLDESVGELASAQRRACDGQGQELFEHVGGRRARHLGTTAILGHQRLEAVVIGDGLPLVVAGARDTESSAGLAHVAASLGLGEQRDAALIDNVIRGHGGGLLDFLLETTESTTRPAFRSSVQPQPWDRKT
jgi:hypothetical protein